MANGDNKRHRHFILEGVTSAETFRPRGGGGQSKKIPSRDREQQGNALLRNIDTLRQHAADAANAQRDAGLEEGLGIQIEFRSFPDIDLAFESLARERQGIELRNVRHEDERVLATVFVPDGKLELFERLVRDYLTRKQDRNGRPRNQRLIDAIANIRVATLRALWTDADEEFPAADEGPLWWEVWLPVPVRDDRQNVLDSFRRLAKAQKIRVAPGELRFPERTVVLAKASVEDMRNSIAILNSIAELRRAKETAEFFDSMEPSEQRERLADLLARTQFAPDNDDVPRVCLLDTGINRGHNLLAHALATSDLHTIESAWGSDDANGHGTQMAGLALAGNLTDCLGDSGNMQIGHRLESIKLLQQSSGGNTDPQLYGHLTEKAVRLPETAAPARPRVFGMTVTARDNRDRGKPSSWSAAVDALAADAHHPRLMIIAAGNVTDPQAWFNYPVSNDSDGIHDPAQAWNALTVGAFTDLVRITGSDTQDYEPVAPAGGLSPFSTTSLLWQKQWPLKPDVTFEGGNTVKDAKGATTMPSLKLLTTHHIPANRSFTTADATSAATALAARFAAQIMAEYPQLWPETVRALIVHSAEWTEAMKRMYLPSNPSKKHYHKLIKRCGFGKPDLYRALWSVSNSLTMVIQESLHPFERTGQNVTTQDMHLHKLPWPAQMLVELGDTPVEMRVTLSYFIEPNPSQRGMKSRYRYESHGLRFDVKRPTDTRDEFRARINATVQREEDYQNSADSKWLIGSQGRHRGSLHGDVWQGSASDLASREDIGVYPAAGWWKTRHALKRYNQPARYSLVVSIKAPETNIDLYSEVANQIRIRTLIVT